jgi:Tol biopolymer transport system component
MNARNRTALALTCIAVIACGGDGGSPSPQAATPRPTTSVTIQPSPSLVAPASPLGPTARCRASQGSGQPLATHPRDGETDPAGRIVFGKLAYSNAMGQVIAPLFAIDPDGSDLVQVLDCDIERPRFSRDGTRLAFSIVLSDGSWQLATSSTDGSDLRILTSTRAAEQTEKTGTPDWSPDGTWLVYARNHTIWRIDADGANDRLIGDPEGFDWEPRVSPDGKSVVYLHGDFVKGVSEPWILDLETGVQRPVNAGNARELEHPDWSPDGKWIVYNTLGPTGEFLERMPSDDDEATPEVLYGSDGHFAAKPAYSPDGESIVFGCDGKLCVMTAAGSDVRVLFSMPNFEVNHIAWGITR